MIEQVGDIVTSSKCTKMNAVTIEVVLGGLEGSETSKIWLKATQNFGQEDRGFPHCWKVPQGTSPDSRRGQKVDRTRIGLDDGSGMRLSNARQKKHITKRDASVTDK